MTRARELARLGNTNALSVDSSNNVGVGTTVPDAKLDVIGIISATSFTGDGALLTGISAGKFSSNDTGINTTTSVGIGTTNAEGAADSNNSKVLNVGVVTANNLYGALTGNASGLSGTPDITIRNLTGVAATFTGQVTYEDVTNIDSIGIITARKGISVTAGVSTFSDDVTFTGSAYNAVWDKTDNTLEFVDGARATFGTGNDLIITHASNQSRIDETSGNGLEIGSIQVTITPNGGGEKMAEFNANGAAELYYDNSKKLETTGAGVTITGVCTATAYYGDGQYLTGISAGISTQANTASGITSTLYLSDAQDHKCTTTGFVTFTCSGGTEGDSHTLRIISSGISTIGFSTYFLWPSGGAPNLNAIANGSVHLISFTVNRVGTAGTQLLAGASLDFS